MDVEIDFEEKFGESSISPPLGGEGWVGLQIGLELENNCLNRDNVNRDNEDGGCIASGRGLNIAIEDEFSAGGRGLNIGKRMDLARVVKMQILRTRMN